MRWWCERWQNQRLALCRGAQLVLLAYKNAVGSRCAAWRKITSVEQKETSKGNKEQAKYAKGYGGKVERELDKICNSILDLFDQTLIIEATAAESKVRK